MTAVLTTIRAVNHITASCVALPRSECRRCLGRVRLDLASCRYTPPVDGTFRSRPIGTLAPRRPLASLLDSYRDVARL
jgi:hypothetical protein